MEFTSTVLHDSELAYYHVTARDAHTCKARLLLNNQSATLPKEVVLQKKNGAWTGDADENLLHFLRFDIERRLKERERIS